MILCYLTGMVWITVTNVCSSPAPALSTGSASKQTVSPTPPRTHTAINPNDWLCIHAYTNTLVYAEPTTPLPIFPHHYGYGTMPPDGEKLCRKYRASQAVWMWGTWCPLSCLCRSFQMSLFTTLFASMKVYSLVGPLPNRPVVLLNM